MVVGVVYQKATSPFGGRFKVDDPALIRTRVDEWRIRAVGGPPVGSVSASTCASQNTDRTAG